MAIGSPIKLDLKHTSKLWAYVSTPLPNPSGNTGVMVCISVYRKDSYRQVKDTITFYLASPLNIQNIYPTSRIKVGYRKARKGGGRRGGGTYELCPNFAPISLTMKEKSNDS